MVISPLVASVAASVAASAAVILTLTHVLMVAYEVSVARRARRAQLMRSFQRLLPVRLVLHVAALLWALAALLRVPLLWQAGWLHPLNVRWRSLRTLCELQPLLAQGLAEPLVLLLVVYSTRHVLQAVGAGGRATEAGADRLEDNPLASAAEGMHGGDSHSTPNPNNPLALLELHETRHYDIGRKDGLHNSAPLDVISRALLTVSPLLLLLTCMVYISALLKVSDRGPDAKPWVATSVNSEPSQCAGRSQGCLVCTTPASGVLLSALFALVYVAYLLRLRTEARRVVLSRVLLGRLELVGAVAVGSTTTGTILRGISLLAPRGGWLFWTVVLSEAMVVLAATTLLPVLLAVRPAFDTSAALRTLAAAPRTLLAAGVASGMPGGLVPPNRLPSSLAKPQRDYPHKVGDSYASLTHVHSLPPMPPPSSPGSTVELYHGTSANHHRRLDSGISDDIGLRL